MTTDIRDKAQEAIDLLMTARSLVHLAQTAADDIDEERPRTALEHGQAITGR